MTAEALARLLHELSSERLAAWEREARVSGRFTGMDHFATKTWEERPADSNRRAVEEAQAILDRLAREGWTMQRLPGQRLDAKPVMAAPGRCGYCGGSMEGVNPGTAVANTRARYCVCGRRKLDALGGGYVLVHREGCDGVGCGCWDTGSGLGAGAAMVTPTGRRVSNG